MDRADVIISMRMIGVALDSVRKPFVAGSPPSLDETKAKVARIADQVLAVVATLTWQAAPPPWLPAELLRMIRGLHQSFVQFAGVAIVDVGDVETCKTALSEAAQLLAGIIVQLERAL